MQAEIVIVGGGLAGSIAAITLARAGRKVILIERETAPHHKVCGEFLSHEALALLKLVGIETARYCAAPLHTVRLARSGKVTECRLPFPAMSLTRMRLDEELLQIASQAGVAVLRGSRVQRIECRQAGWETLLDSDKSILCDTVFVATGKHDLPGDPRPIGKQTGMVGFKMYFRLERAQAAELDGHVELLLYRGGYGGLQPVEDGMANLCCLVHRDELKRLGGRWEQLLAAIQTQCPHLSIRLDGATPLLEKPLAISSIPYGYVRNETPVGLWRLGDQAAVIPSFTGDGMSIALHSGRLAAEMYLAGADSVAYQRELSMQVGRQVAMATVLARGLVWRPTRMLMSAAAGSFPRALSLVAGLTRLRKGVRLA